MHREEYQVQVDVPSTEWPSLLEPFADANLYQTWSYGAIRWGERNLSRLALSRKGQVVALAQLRLICPPYLPGGIAYLRWGPVSHRRDANFELEPLRQAARALHREYVEKRGLFLRIVPPAFAGSERGALFSQAFAELCHPSPNPGELDRTLLVDLAPSLEQLRKNLDQKWRNQLNRAEKNNLTISEGNGTEHYRLFTEMYQQMWARKRFETTVDVHEFERLQEHLAAKERMKVLICSQQGTPVAGVVCSAMGDTGIYLLGATSDQGLQAKGAYLLQWTMIRWLKENGFRYYDLGGIDPEKNPGVYHFKSGLSGQDLCRLAPLEACRNRLSALCMKLADVSRRGWRSLLQPAGNGKSPVALPQTS